MSIKIRDKEFRTPKTSYIDYKHIEMDRVLTLLFPLLKYDGKHTSIPSRGFELSVDHFVEEFLNQPDIFEGFEQNKDVLYKWIETDLMDMVSRGKSGQVIAAPRPLHGNTYKFRNAKHCRDYNAADQVYWMLYYARKSKGGAALSALRKFFFKGMDLTAERYDSHISVDVETQAILRLDKQVIKDKPDIKEPIGAAPLCIGRADILADDILKILAYEQYIPRSVMVDYIKTLLAFHLALYHLNLMFMLPKITKQCTTNSICGTGQCPVNPSVKDTFSDCPYKQGVIADVGNPNNTHISSLAQNSAERLYRQIPIFVQSNFIIKKLEEFAEYLEKIGRFKPSSGSVFTINDLLVLLTPDYVTERQAFFKSRLAAIIDDTGEADDALDPEIKEVIDMQLDDFNTYIEILMAYRGRFHTRYITQCLDSLLQKNKDNGLLIQKRAVRSPRHIYLGSKLLEVLLQIAVLDHDGTGFYTKQIRIEDLLAMLRNRYGLYIDRLPNSEMASIYDKQALRYNAEAFKQRLREIGFYTDLSDAYITQMVKPRYTIESIKSGNDGGRL